MAITPLMSDVSAWNERMFLKYNNERMYYHPNPIVRYIETKRVSKIVNLLSDKRTSKILEVGCGEGYILNRFDSCKDLVGIDLSKTAIKRARARLQNKNVRLFLKNAETMRLQEKFDGIILSEVLEHVVHPERVVDNILPLCHNGTKIVITIPNEKIINRIKDAVHKTNLFSLILPNVSKRMEWHIHDFDLGLLKKILKGKLIIETIVPLPCVFLPVRYVVECKLNPHYFTSRKVLPIYRQFG